jgi:hypothetical protein
MGQRPQSSHLSQAIEAVQNRQSPSYRTVSFIILFSNECLVESRRPIAASRGCHQQHRPAGSRPSPSRPGTVA